MSSQELDQGHIVEAAAKAAITKLDEQVASLDAELKKLEFSDANVVQEFERLHSEIDQLGQILEILERDHWRGRNAPARQQSDYRLHTGRPLQLPITNGPDLPGTTEIRLAIEPLVERLQDLWPNYRKQTGQADTIRRQRDRWLDKKLEIQHLIDSAYKPTPPPLTGPWQSKGDDGAASTIQ